MPHIPNVIFFLCIFTVFVQIPPVFSVISGTVSYRLLRSVEKNNPDNAARGGGGLFLRFLSYKYELVVGVKKAESNRLRFLIKLLSTV